MRRTMTIFALSGVLALAVGCKKKDEEAPAPAPKTTAPADPTPEVKELTAEDKLKIWEDCWAAADAKDADKLAACYHDDAMVRIVDSVPPMEAKGPKAAMEMYKGFWTAFPDGKHTMAMVAINGNKVASFFTYEGTNDGEFMGMPATKKPVKLWAAHIAELDKDGKVVKDDHYFDGGTMMAQLGVSPNPMAPTAESITAPEERMTAIASDDDAGKANLELMKKSEELMKNKDFDGMVALYGDDAEFIYSASAEPAKGIEAIKKGMGEWASMHSALEVTTRDMWTAGDWVVAETTAKGTIGKDMKGVPVKTKGKSYESQYLEFFHIADGKIQKHMIFTNSSKWAADIGLLDAAKKQGDAKKAK